MKPVISCALSPNLRFSDVLTAVRSLMSPHDYFLGDGLNYSGLFLKRIFLSPGVFLFMRARDGEYTLLKSLGVKKGDEVMIQAFTCAAVVQPVLWTGARPIFVDITEKTLSLDPDDLLKKISAKTKVIILQSTFGIEPEIQKIKKIAKKYKIFVLLDLAHVFNPSQIAKTHCDAYLLSFGRDKAISSVTGGALVVRDRAHAAKVEALYSKTQFPSNQEVVRFLLHPPITYLVQLLFLIHPFLGKAANRAYKKSKIVPRPVVSELTLKSSSIQKYPNALARILFKQLNASEGFNKKRVEWALLYAKNNLISIPYKKPVPLLRVPYRTSHKKALKKFCKEDIVYLGDWYSHVIDPVHVPLSALGYKKRSCPVAERVAKEIVNLPVNPTLRKKDIMRVIRLIKKYESDIS